MSSSTRWPTFDEECARCQDVPDVSRVISGDKKQAVAGNIIDALESMLLDRLRMVFVIDGPDSRRVSKGAH
jgi:hypothetical protein